MKRIRSTYHILNVLKEADPKLRKDIITNSNRETLKRICEFPLNVLRGNIPLSACCKFKLRAYKNSICKVADNSVSLQQAKCCRSAMRMPSPAAVCHITHSRRAYIPFAFTMLRKVNLVSPEFFRNKTSRKSSLPFLQK